MSIKIYIYNIEIHSFTNSQLQVIVNVQETNCVSCIFVFLQFSLAIFLPWVRGQTTSIAQEIMVCSEMLSI